ncbi:hypothetical protein [Chitinophaga tropicalis]|uniref:Tetratricopeptide repeat protein n=1 Tax=Chitinophaga tropicalis TaxID=2683588 RepID=A0A7K1U4G3_9BACT|nr:hypothetical protein [Chitinophaga tropicalis]MVT09229.1 hypothetical protein [Chitinophaga tropicalis]
MTANRIIQHIFQQPDIKQVDESAIDRLVSAYPYFTAARLLLARKQYSTQRNLLAPGVKKAQQYSTNMHYFFRFVTTDEKSLAEAVAVPAPVPVPAEETNTIITAEEKVTETTSVAAPVQETPASITVVPAAQQTTYTFHQPAETTPAPVEIPAVSTPVAAVPVTDEQISAAPVVTEQAASQEVVATAATVTEQVTAPQEVVAATVPVTEQETAASAAETEDADPIKIFPLEIPEADNTLTFQPLYTDDYFAYKRLKEPENAEHMSERGEAEMKSFTSWLKDMKRSFAEKAGREWYHQQLHRSYEDIDPGVSETVEKMAMESITLNDDIVSETLAEIWARQHQYQTAIHIYQKLSLLNPNKSAYFAQKIKELQLLTEKN